MEKTACALLSDRDKVKAQEVLLSPNALQFMSSEESDDDGATSSGSGPKPQKSRKLVWERSKLTNIKKRLDDAHFEGLRERQRRASARVSRSGQPSGRPRPTNGPHWETNIPLTPEVKP